MSHAPDPDILAVLDPAKSAVVEACAGSGKTWLLAARIVRLLLAGALPGEILAITFTRKAAREIEERVVDGLRGLALADDAAVVGYLRERGVPDAAIDASSIARARGLYELLTEAQPGLTVNTFHGWFLQLVAAAPLSAGLAGMRLTDAGSRRFDELWQSFAARLQQAPDSPASLAFVRLLAVAGQHATRQLVASGMARRAEWLMLVGEMPGAWEKQLESLREFFGAGDEQEVLADFFVPGWDIDFHCYLGFLETSETETDRRLAQRLSTALSEQDSLRSLPPEIALSVGIFAAVAGTVLTEKGSLRVRKPSKALDGRFGADGARRFLDLHVSLGERLIACRSRLQDARNFSFNRDALCVHAAFLAHLADTKASRRQIDFVDVEWEVFRLLADDESAPYVQARLDARYRHILLDEFQDTNPLQWQILQAWLAAYAGTDAGRPTVFLVGDPKQSIYRFRGAEPRLFATAADFLEAGFAAHLVARDVTRRNSPAIIAVVNALFSVEPAFVPFREQHALQQSLPGFVELLPLTVGEGPVLPEGADAPALRDPLTQPAIELHDGRREQEALQLAERLRAMIGCMQIRAPGGEGERPLAAGDVMLLVRSRTQIAVYERALAAAGIPYVAASRGGLLDSLEVRDVAALLEFLVTPAADLALAHALKSPLFACSDEDLQRIAARPEATWWLRLEALASGDDLADNGEDEARGDRLHAGISLALQRAVRLLAEWLSLAPTLPAHDLLDHIYDIGEVRARYRLAVPEARRAAALANLEALLLLALDVDGGRYPSLPRFIDELRALRRADDDDSPDEGELAANDSAVADGRVRILTIHGAKGLEAPVVWLLDANPVPRPERGWAPLVDWPPGAPAPRHFSFVGRRAEAGAARADLLAAEAAAAEREELNLLYVAITRAQQVFIASGSENSRASDTSPYARLMAALARLGVGELGRYGESLPELPSALHSETLSALAGAGTPVVPLQAEGGLPSVPAVGERRSPLDPAARFGILLHAILERRVPGQGGASLVEQGEGGSPWWRAMGYSDGDLANAMPVAERLIAAPALRRFFAAECYRRAWNEVEFTDSAGNLFRIDRLVEDGEGIWVLDYKSSGSDTDRLSEYHLQVLGYCRAVAEVFANKSVCGVLVFSDASMLRVCSTDQAIDGVKQTADRAPVDVAGSDLLQ